MRSIVFHLFLPQMRMSHEAIVERAQAAEAAGFEGMAFMDHLVPPNAPEQDMWEAMSISAWILAHTSELTVGHLVLCDSMRHPAVLARQATSLDHASGGRFELGIGWGSVPDELRTFGIGSTEPRRRVDRLAESLQIIRALWTGEVIDHAGEYFTLEGAQQRPVPIRTIPITIGGVGPRTLDLVREHADWWNVPIHRLDDLDGLRPRAGDASVSVQKTVWVLADETERAEVTDLVERRFGPTPIGREMTIGTADELVAHFAAERDRGVGRFYVWFGDFAPPDTLRRFAPVVAALSG